jgi:hypothetical protein
LLLVADGGGYNRMKCSCSGYERLLELTSVCPEGEDVPSDKEVHYDVPEADNWGGAINSFRKLTKDKLSQKFVPFVAVCGSRTTIQKKNQ